MGWLEADVGCLEADAKHTGSMCCGRSQCCDALARVLAELSSVQAGAPACNSLLAHLPAAACWRLIANGCRMARCVQWRLLPAAGVHLFSTPAAALTFTSFELIARWLRGMAEQERRQEAAGASVLGEVPMSAEPVVPAGQGTDRA